MVHRSAGARALTPMAPPVFLIIVQRGQTSVFDTFCQEAADRTTVLWDRRERDRRGPWRIVTPERRVTERRDFRVYWTAFGFLVRCRRP